MTIVKGPAPGGIHRFRSARAIIFEEVAAPAPDPRIALLEDEIATLRADLVKVRRDAAAAIEAAREEGAREVMLDERERLDAVLDGLRAAQAAWQERLDATERLAPAIARAAVERMFGEADLPDLVVRSAAAYARRVGAGAILAMRVSPLDFPDPHGLADARRSIGLEDGALTADAALGAGACRVDLRIGHAELDPALQWAEIERILDAADAC